MKNNSTTHESACVFGNLRECVKYGPLSLCTTFPSNIELDTSRINCNGQYVDQYFTTKFDNIGIVKFRLYRNDLEIILGSKTVRIPDLERYYTDKNTITLQKTDRTYSLLCEDIMHLISDIVN